MNAMMQTYRCHALPLSQNTFPFMNKFGKSKLDIRRIHIKDAAPYAILCVVCLSKNVVARATCRRLLRIASLIYCYLYAAIG